MNKLKVLGITGIFISVISFYLVKSPVTSLFSDPDAISEEILSQAKMKITKPAFPSKPAGKTVTKQKTVKHKIQVPSPTITNPLRMKTKVVDIKVPHEVFVGPSTSEIKNWQNKIKQIETSYEQKLAQEIKKLEFLKEEQFRESLQSWGTIIGGIIFGFGGIVTIVVSIRKERREQEKHDLEMSKHV
jgi:hypothetical protein